jgi:hypothetical protein
MAQGVLVDVIRARCGDALKGEPVVQDARHDLTAGYQQALKPSRR